MGGITKGTGSGEIVLELAVPEAIFFSPRRRGGRGGTQRESEFSSQNHIPVASILPAPAIDAFLRRTVVLEEFQVTEAIIGAAIEVHRQLGPGLLENGYEHCLCIEFDIRNIPYERQKVLPVEYKGRSLGGLLRLDLLILDKVIVELKAIEEIKRIHEAQLLTYLRLTKKRVGILLNFNVEQLRDGICRKVLTQ